MAKNPKKLLDVLKSAAASVELPSAAMPIPRVRDNPNLWSIVVLGTIDVRQHTPNWYDLIDVISKQELEAASKTFFIIGVPPAGVPGQQPGLCQFDVGTFAIIVMPDRWTIQTVDGNNRERIAQVAATIFRKLNEIAVAAYGVNRTGGVRTKGSAKQFLSGKLAMAGLALPDGNAECSIYYANHEEKSDTTFQLSPSPVDDREINVVHNRHHPIRLTDFPGYYDVGKMILENAESDWRAAAKYLEELSASISQAEKD